jgi:hypothetical protein
MKKYVALCGIVAALVWAGVAAAHTPRAALGCSLGPYV